MNGQITARHNLIKGIKIIATGRDDAEGENKPTEISMISHESTDVFSQNGPHHFGFRYFLW